MEEKRDLRFRIKTNGDHPDSIEEAKVHSGEIEKKRSSCRGHLPRFPTQLCVDQRIDSSTTEIEAP